jgi:sulfofructose kinase
MSDYDCLGFGICAADYLCIVPRYPGLDEKTEAVEFFRQGGGPVAMALVTLARFGCKTSFISLVGDDIDGKFIIAEFQREGVDTAGIIIDKSIATNQAFIWIDRPTGKKSIVLNNRNHRQIAPSEIVLSHIGSVKYLLLDGRDTDASFDLIRWAKAGGVKIVMDAGSPRNSMNELLAVVDYPVVSQVFCQQFLKTNDYKIAVEKLLNFGATAAVVTCGKQGCYGGDASGLYFQNAFPVEVVDTTGAGDVFHGAFLFGLLNNWELPEILKFASAAAAIKCTRLGGRSGIPDLATVNKFLES